MISRVFEPLKLEFIKFMNGQQLHSIDTQFDQMWDLKQGKTLRQYLSKSIKQGQVNDIDKSPLKFAAILKRQANLNFHAFTTTEKKSAQVDQISTAAIV